MSGNESSRAATFERTPVQPRRRLTFRRVALWGGLAALGYAGWRLLRGRSHAGYATRPTLPAEKAIEPARPSSVPVHGTPT